MTDPGFGGLPRPQVTLDAARELAARLFGVTGEATELGSQQDRNVLLDGPRGRFLLKIGNPAFLPEETAAQNAAMRAVAAHGIACPTPVPTLDGREQAEVELDGRRHIVRLLSFVEGAPLIDRPYLADAVRAELGAVAGRVSEALAPLAGAGFERRLQWDLRHAEDVVAELRDFVPAERRTLIDAATAAAGAALAPLRELLPLQVVHGDLTDDNVVTEPGPDGRPRITGVIDFGDVAVGWRVAELAVSCSAVFHHRPGSPLAVLPLIAAFDERVPLTDDEIAAIWPLLVLRGATLVVSGEQQVVIDPENDYADSAREREWRMFAVPAAFDTRVATAAIRRRLGRPVESEPVPAGRPLLPAVPAVVDLGWSSRALRDGDWLAEPRGTEVRVLAAAAARAGAAATRYGEARLTRSHAPSATAPHDVALGIELRVASPQALTAPFPGRITPVEGGLRLVGERLELRIDGVDGSAEREVAAGDALGTVDGTAWLQLVAREGLVADPPRYVPADEAAAWTIRCPDPSTLLGITAAPQEETRASVLRRREGSYSTLQSHYYADPPRIERGWREFLIDTDGRHLVDMVNNVTALGHGHPRIAAAAADQWSMLNTNSRFSYGAVGDLSERLLATVPAPFDTVLLVNSGSEAVDLALRLARAFTGRPDVLCVQESYHGWTVASDAVSTALSDNPLAGETRPEWVHVVDAPNAYRGRHRGEDAGARYAADAVMEIDRLAAAGTPLGAFIAEPRNGNAGAIEVPPGYLAAVSAAVRRHGGVWIDDEVQVGYGRQGDVFWGYQQHEGVLPDVITVAKAMGNGHPLGAVITRREIADALAAQGSFFSSAGGSTLSARIGVEVLAVLHDEGLQEHAQRIGARLRERLERMQARHPMIGALHGRGLYQGVELVRDRETLEPATAEAGLICDRMLELGVVVQPTGDRQNVLKVKPPLCIGEASADRFVDALDAVLRDGW
ncbi:MAG TPA: aminotransferase [Amnibacterium sp.]|uniref:aminotransferase n=1 Tax=Amnibacterium sp. TaxID=1872496 RepID=UPI002F95849E